MTTVKLVTATGLERALTAFKAYIDAKSIDTEAFDKLVQRFDDLMGEDGDENELIDTIKDIREFLRQFSEGDDLKDMLDGILSGVASERERAEAAENGLSRRVGSIEDQNLDTRVKKLEEIEIMESEEALDIFD